MKCRISILIILLLAFLLAAAPSILCGCGDKAAESNGTIIEENDDREPGDDVVEDAEGEEYEDEEEDDSATRTPPVGFGYGTVQGGSGGIMLLKDVVFSENGDYERIVIELTTGQGDPPREGVCMYDANMGELPYSDLEGNPAAVAGDYFFEITLDARTADLNLPDAPNVYEGPDVFDLNIPLIKGATFVTAYADHTIILLVGLDDWAPFRIEEMSNPSRIVIDFAPS
jgi:hypothetical protein